MCLFLVSCASHRNQEVVDFDVNTKMLANINKEKIKNIVVYVEVDSDKKREELETQIETVLTREGLNISASFKSLNKVKKLAVIKDFAIKNNFDHLLYLKFDINVIRLGVNTRGHRSGFGNTFSFSNRKAKSDYKIDSHLFSLKDAVNIWEMKASASPEGRELRFVESGFVSLLKERIQEVLF